MTNLIIELYYFYKKSSKHRKTVRESLKCLRASSHLELVEQGGWLTWGGHCLTCFLIHMILTGPRTAGKQRPRANAPAEDPKKSYRRNTVIPF